MSKQITDLIGSVFQKRTSVQLKLKFVLVGIWNTIFGYSAFFLFDIFFENILYRRHVAYMSAMILGQVFSTFNAFIFHKYVTFKSEVKGKGIMVEFFRFSLTYVVTFMLSLFLLPFFVEIIDFHPRTSGAIAILICTVISYVGHSRYSFQRG